MSDTEAKDKKEKKFKFNNGWTEELEKLAADWTDRAQCYRWMHDKSYQTLALYNQYMMIPVIILSTLAGTANFGLDTIFPDPTSEKKKIATLGIGSIGILTGIITTLANFFRYAQLSEAHSGAAISWAKFSRLLVIELSLHPNERSDAFTFLKMFRVELDRLIEQSPVIPEFIIVRFNKEFNTKIDIKRPEITGAIEHTRVFDNRNERLKQVATEAAIAIAQKKKILHDLVLTDIDKRIHQIVDAKPYSIVHNRKGSITSYMPVNNSYVPTNTTGHKYEKKDPKQELAQIPRGFVGDLKRTLAIRKQEEAKSEKKEGPAVLVEEPKSEPKQEEPKQEEPKQEEPKQEEPKQEEPKQEEPKKEENTIVTVFDVVIKPE